MWSKMPPFGDFIVFWPKKGVFCILSQNSMLLFPAMYVRVCMPIQ